MKESIKKLTVAVCAAAITAMISTVAVTAAETARPMPDGSGTTTTTQTMNTSSGETGETAAVTATQAPVTNNVVNTANNVTTSSSQTSNKKYQSRLGGFLWFILSVVVNFILSCWIGNRFYNLAKKSNQSSAEIRALRKDIEEKFSSTLKDISEPAIEVMNSNENYARNDEGIVMPDRHSKIEMNDEEREIFRKWDAQRTGSKHNHRVSSHNEDEYEDFDSDREEEEEIHESRQRKPQGSAYRPTRRSSGIEFDDEEDDDYYDDEDYDYDEHRTSSKKRPAKMNDRREGSSGKKKSINKARGKAKDFLSNVFPFDE